MNTKRPTSAPPMRLDKCNDITLELKPSFGYNRGHQNSIETVVINPMNPNQALTASHDQKIAIWDLNTCQTTKVIDNAHKSGVWCAQYNHQGTQFASCGPDTVVKIWNAKNNKVDSVFKGHTNYVYWVDFDQSGTKLVSGGKNSELILWDAKKGKQIISARTEGKIVNCARIDPSGRYVFTAEKKGWLEAWDLNDRCRHLGKVQIPNVSNVHQIDFDFTSTNYPKIYIADSSGHFRVLTFDGMFFKQIDSFEAHTDMVKAIKVIPSKQLLVTGCRDSGIKVWDMKDWQFVAQLTRHKDQVVSLAHHPDMPDRLVTGSWDQSINCYDLTKLSELRERASEKLLEIEQSNMTALKEANNMKDAWEAKLDADGQIRLK